MTPLEKFRQQVAIAKASAAGDLKSYVVQTADEAQALLDEIDTPRSVTFNPTPVQAEEIRREFANPRPGRIVSMDAPGDDEVI